VYLDVFVSGSCSQALTRTRDVHAAPGSRAHGARSASGFAFVKRCIDMRRLIEGVVRFQGEVFPEHRDLFHRLATTQEPEALLLTCSDSRVVPQLIVQSQPGDLFICRNAGNIAPPYSEPTGGVAATIEYAVMALNVRHIIVCGHSDCGAMRALLEPEKIGSMPAVRRWLGHAARAETVVRENFGHLSEADRLNALIEENVLTQIDHLRTYPCVASRLRAGTLALHGWVYDIESGQIRAFGVGDQSCGALDPSAVQVDAPVSAAPVAAENVHV
jgi:carbonic anhydrase